MIEPALAQCDPALGAAQSYLDREQRANSVIGYNNHRLRDGIEKSTPPTTLVNPSTLKSGNCDPDRV